MKPYTLEWWIFQLEVANRFQSDYDVACEITSNKSCKIEAKRYRELAEYIGERIINKYGE